MTWREKLVIRILLLVARIVAVGVQLEGNVRLADEIRNLANYISVNLPDVSAIIKRDEP